MINEKHICLYYGKQVFWQRQPRVSGGSSAIFVSNRTKVPFWFFLTKWSHSDTWSGVVEPEHDFWVADSRSHVCTTRL